MSVFEMFITVCFNLLKDQVSNLPTIREGESSGGDLAAQMKEIEDELKKYEALVGKEMSKPMLSDLEELL